MNSTSPVKKGDFSFLCVLWGTASVHRVGFVPAELVDWWAWRFSIVWPFGVTPYLFYIYIYVVFVWRAAAAAVVCVGRRANVVHYAVGFFRADWHVDVSELEKEKNV